jgi:quercetin dioxygenase-like cupin family protein
MRALLATLVIAMLAACATPAPRVDATLDAIERANVRACPPERVQAGAQTQGFGATVGVRVEDIALVPSASDLTRAVRLRRIIVAPGGVIAWHDHTQVQGMALLVAGEMTELRNTCLDPLIYRAGDVAIEDVDTAHSWRNDGAVAAVILVSHIVAQN